VSETVSGGTETPIQGKCGFGRAAVFPLPVQAQFSSGSGKIKFSSWDCISAGVQAGK